jgi:hypothetical protein
MRKELSRMILSCVLFSFADLNEPLLTGSPSLDIGPFVLPTSLHWPLRGLGSCSSGHIRHVLGWQHEQMLHCQWFGSLIVHSDIRLPYRMMWLENMYVWELTCVTLERGHDNPYKWISDQTLTDQFHGYQFPVNQIQWQLKKKVNNTLEWAWGESDTLYRLRPEGGINMRESRCMRWSIDS